MRDIVCSELNWVCCGKLGQAQTNSTSRPLSQSWLPSLFISIVFTPQKLTISIARKYHVAIGINTSDNSKSFLSPLHRLFYQYWPSQDNLSQRQHRGRGPPSLRSLKPETQLLMIVSEAQWEWSLLEISTILSTLHVETSDVQFINMTEQKRSFL